MKQSGKMNTALRRCMIYMLVAAVLLTVLPWQLAEAATAKKVEKLNVMLVIDGSGSLRKETDTRGLRYEAINLFLALLTNDGNNVGAIVFNEDIVINTGINALSGKAAKEELAKQIKDAGAMGDTNIGGALMAAVDATIAKSNENGLNSVIILFSDGRSDINGFDSDETKASLEVKEEATDKAQANGIPVYSICLNNSSVASPDELREISERTSGSFVAVQKPEDLTGAFEAFYSLIFPDTSNILIQTTFPAEGTLSSEFQIPTYGAEEVNIILNMENVNKTKVVTPHGEMTADQVEETSMKGGAYKVIKLVNPENGMWKVDLAGKPGAEVTINVLYNIDSVAHLELAGGKTDYKVGESAEIVVNLVRQGQILTDPSVTQEYVAKLHLVNQATGKTDTVDMTPGANGTFTYRLNGSDYCTWGVTAELIYGELSLVSNSENVNFGNTSPVASPNYEEVKVTVTPFSGKSHSMDVSQYFTDEQDTQLTYSIVSSQLISGTVTLDSQSGALDVDTSKSKKGNVIIQAADSQGATAELTVFYNVKDVRGVIFGGAGLLVLAGLIVLAVILYGVLNRPWKGMFTVTSLDGGIDRTHGGFRGKVPLKKLGIRGCGLDGAFVATGNNRMEFRSNKPIYSASGYQSNPKRVSLMNGTNTIYADEEHTMGIEVEVMPKNGGFSF